MLEKHKMKRFNKYKKIKEQIRYSYNGYPVEKIVAIDIAVWVFAERKFNIKSYLSYLIKHTLPFFVTSLNLHNLKLNEPTKTLFSMGLFGREDYYEVWEDVKKRVDKKISFDFSKQNYRFRLDIKKILLAWSLIRKVDDIELIGKLWLAAKITYYLNIIDELEKINPVVGKYCSFSSEHDHEALLTRYFQKKNIKTYSLQHGIDFIHRERVELSAILYENFMTDLRLCWGQYTKDEFVEYGVNEHSLMVAGYPRKITRPPLPDKLNKKECLVFLGSYPYHEANMKLIQILEHLNDGINFDIKLHPRSNRSVYKKIVERNNWNLIGKKQTLTDLFNSNKYGWTIAVNSSAYYESYLYNIPGLRFNDGSFMDLVDIKNDRFSNLQELKECLSFIPFENPDKIPEYFNEVNKNLDYVIGIDKDEYHILNCNPPEESQN